MQIHKYTLLQKNDRGDRRTPKSESKLRTE